MATDIAKIGFSVETSQLEKGVATLNSFSASAKSANSNAQSVGTAMNQASKVFAAAVSAMSKSISSLVSVTKGATVEQIAAAKEASEFADRIYRAAQAQDKLTTSTQKAATAVRSQQTILQKQLTLQNQINKLTGVTGLSGGSAFASFNVFKREMGKNEWNEATGVLTRDLMPNRFNTANIAAQFQDIGVTAAMGMNPMLIALQQGTQLAAVMNSMEAPLKGLGEAFKQIVNPVSLLSIGLTALAVVGLQMVDWTGVAESSLNGLADIMNYVADNAGIVTSALAAVTVAITAFNKAAVFSTVTSGLKTMLTILTSLAGVVAAVLTSPITLTIAAVTGLTTVFIKFEDEINSFFGFDFVSVVKSAVNAMIGSFIAGFEAIWEGAKWVWDKIQSLWNGGEGPSGSLMDALNKGVDDALGRDYIGAASDAVSSAATVASNKLREWSSGLREMSKEAKKAAQAWKDLNTEASRKIADLQLEQGLIGAGTYESTYWKTRQDLINQANDNNIQLTPDKLDTINQFAESTARLSEKNEKLTETYEFAKSTTNSFFQDLRQGLMDGANAWETFGSAALNVLDSILSKMMDVGVDYLFQSMRGAGMFGGVNNVTGTAATGGNVTVMEGSYVGPFAKGGAFTNGVYNSPTLFKFAKGNKFGVMGEAGPEAVMPLRRGSDGSLGVQADGIGDNVVVNVYNNSNAQASVNQKQTSQGTEIDVTIDQMVAQKIGQPGTSSNNALRAFNNQRLIAR